MAEEGRIEMYDRDDTNTSMGALVELCRALRQYRRDIVLAGGWAPYFLTQGYFDHCGSIDIDFVLRPRTVERYERIQRILKRLGYGPTKRARGRSWYGLSADRINLFSYHRAKIFCL